MYCTRTDDVRTRFKPTRRRNRERESRRGGKDQKERRSCAGASRQFHHYIFTLFTLENLCESELELRGVNSRSWPSSRHSAAWDLGEKICSATCARMLSTHTSLGERKSLFLLASEACPSTFRNACSAAVGCSLHR